VTADLAAEIAAAARRMYALIGWADTQCADEHTDRQYVIDDLCQELTDLADHLRDLR